jgi:hypothetical protein
MKRLVEIVPAPPGWYARWKFGHESTVSIPVTVWALVEDGDPSNRHVVGVDADGKWPGAADIEAGDFVRYIFQAPGDGPPEDLFSPARAAAA